MKMAVPIIEHFINKIPNRMPAQNGLDGYKLRWLFVENGMFGFVSKKWIKPFAKWAGNRKCLEVMAGKGVLTHALRQEKADVIAVDDYSWTNEYQNWTDTLTRVEKFDAVKAVKKYGKEIDIVIMSWAPYKSPVGFEVLKALYEVNPDAVLVSIDEGMGRCIADDDFFRHFESVEDKAFENAATQFERWRSIHDRPTLGRYKPKPTASSWELDEDEEDKDIA